jgi:Stress-induced bacterial acidophilic repeat motif
MTVCGPQEPVRTTPDAPRSIALARSYSDVQRAIADYCERTALTRAELDAEAGIADGNAAKALARRARKRLGWVTLGRVLAAAGLVLIVAIDPDAPLRDFVASQSASRVRYSRAKHWRNVKGPAWGRRMAALRALKLSPERRREIARKGGQARHRRRPQQSPEQPA